MTTTAPTTPVYPNSAEGAKQALKELSVYTTADLTTATQDPSVEGVWKVNHSAAAIAKYGTDFSIVYLAGYKGPWGDKRTFNDFEDSYTD